MAIERLWTSIGAIAFTADGGADGSIIIADVCGFRVKQQVVISALSLPSLVLEVKRVVSATKLILGPKVTTGKMIARQDLSAYTIALMSTIRAEEQPKVRVPPPDVVQAVYEQEPVVALRTFGVDCYGNPWGDDNPLPVLATISATSTDNDPTEQRIQNIAFAAANTEYSISLPTGTKRYQIRVRDDSSKGRIAFASGETLTKYWTLTRGTIVDSYIMDLPISSVVYMQLDKATQVVEVRAWVKP